MNLRPLTEAQRRVLVFVREFHATNGYPPTRAEISEAMGFKSPNAAQDHLSRLEEKGFIKFMPGISRGIKILEASA